MDIREASTESAPRRRLTALGVGLAWLAAGAAREAVKPMFGARGQQVLTEISGGPVTAAFPPFSITVFILPPA